MEYLIKTKSIGGMTEDQFFHFCQENDPIKFEKNAKGDIIIMAPTGSESGMFNLGIGSKLYNWNNEMKLGYAFDSNAGFTLPNNAVRSPDAAFIKKDKWLALSKDDRKKFAHICPDFVIELRSASDNLSELKLKMEEWISNGCALAWLIDPVERETIIYRNGKKPEVKSFDSLLDGEETLPGFSLLLTEIFDTDL